VTGKLPTGTVTFLRTDVEGSMRLAQEFGPQWDELNETHLRSIRKAVAHHGGRIVRTEGDAVFAVFPEARAAVRAAVDAQLSLNAENRNVAVRMGVHSGEAHLSGDDYGGFEVNRAARIAGAAHGGQVVLSESTRALVVEDLPSGTALRDLGEHILKGVPRPERLYQLDIVSLRSSFPPLRTGRPAPGNLPIPLTTFVGRTTDLAELSSLLGSARLITLTGPGGIGKTRLGIELAGQHAPGFRDGAWFVALDLIDDPAQVNASIARTIGLFDGPARPAATGLLDHVAERSMLLVLDNFEHVLNASGDVGALLRAGPQVRVIATSRAPLRIAGEQEYPVRPLLQLTGVDPSRESDDAASALFADRARAVRPDWQPGPHQEAVRDICRMVDGLPLGIELAAARISLMPVEALRDRLHAGIGLPGEGPRDTPARQRTLDAAIGWSYELLPTDQQSLLARLSVFDGSFDHIQASAVAGAADVLDGLLALAEQSLLNPEAGAPAPAPSGIRFRMLTTIQAFAAARLAASGEERAVRQRHALSYLDLAETAAQRLHSPERPEWLARLALDHANLRSALRWAIDSGEAETAQRFLPALWRFWQVDGHLHEGRALADEALAMPSGKMPTKARMWAVAAGGNLAYWQGDTGATSMRYEEEREIARHLKDHEGEADAAFNLAHTVFIGGGETAHMVELLTDARARYEAIADARGVARCDWGLANTLMMQGQIAEAATRYRELEGRFERLGDVQYAAMATSSLAWAAFAQGDREEGAALAIRGLVATHRTRDAATTTISLQEAALVAMILRRPEAAAELMGAFEGLCQRYGVRPPTMMSRFLRELDPSPALRDALDPERLAAALERGRRMTLDEAVDMVVGLGGLA